MKDALYMLYDAWDEASPESICKAYNKLKIHSNNSQANSEPEQQHSAGSMVKMLQLVQEVGNKDSLNAHDLEDWLNLDNVLPTRSRSQTNRFWPPLSDIPMKMKVATRKMMAQRRNKFPIQSQQNILKSAFSGWKDRAMFTLFKSCNFTV